MTNVICIRFVIRDFLTHTHARGQTQWNKANKHKNNNGYKASYFSDLALWEFLFARLKLPVPAPKFESIYRKEKNVLEGLQNDFRAFLAIGINVGRRALWSEDINLKDM